MQIKRIHINYTLKRFPFDKCSFKEINRKCYFHIFRKKVVSWTYSKIAYIYLQHSLSKNYSILFFFARTFFRRCETSFLFYCWQSGGNLLHDKSHFSIWSIIYWNLYVKRYCWFYCQMFLEHTKCISFAEMTYKASIRCVFVYWKLYEELFKSNLCFKWI